MRKTSLFITLILMVTLFASCGTQSETVQPDSSVSPVASDETTAPAPAAEEKLNVTVPDGWVKNEASVLEHQYMKNTASLMIKKENYTQDTLSDVTAEMERIFKDSFDAYQSFGTEDIQVAGRDAKKLVFTCNVSSLSMKYMYVFLYVNNDVYVITFGDQASTFDDLSADYESILSSLTIN